MKRAALPLSFSAIGSGGGKPPPYEGVHHWPFRRAGIFSLWNDRHRRSWLFVSLRYATPRRPRRSTAPVRPNAQRRTPGYRRRGQAPALRRREDHRRPRPPLGGGCHEVTGGVPSVRSAALPCLPWHSLSHRRPAPLTAPSVREPGKDRPGPMERTSEDAGMVRAGWKPAPTNAPRSSYIPQGVGPPFFGFRGSDEKVWRFLLDI